MSFEWLSGAMVERLGWALVHSLWIGVAAAILHGGLMAGLRRRAAQARYAASCAVLALFMAGVVAAFVLLAGDRAAGGKSGDLRSGAHGAAVVRAGDSMSGGIRRSPASPEETGVGSREGVGRPPEGGTTNAGGLPQGGATIESKPPKGGTTVVALRELLAEALEPALPWLVLAWACGVGALGIWEFSGWVGIVRLRQQARAAESALVQRVRQLAQRLGLRRAVGVLESARVRVPTVMGWLRPVILLPAGFALGLSPAQVDAILVHELWHIRRHDYLVNLAQTLVETLLFYHPATWLISRRIRREREHCCDDAVVALGADGREYAESLLEVARQSALRGMGRTGLEGVGGVGMAATGRGGKTSELRRRIARLMGEEGTGRGRHWPVVLAAGLVVMGMALAMTLRAQGTGMAPHGAASTEKAAAYDWPTKMKPEAVAGLWVQRPAWQPGPTEPNIYMMVLNGDKTWAEVGVWGEAEKPTKVEVLAKGPEWGLEEGGAPLMGSVWVGVGLVRWMDAAHSSEYGDMTITRVEAGKVTCVAQPGTLVIGLEYEKASEQVRAAMQKALAGSGVTIGAMPAAAAVDWPGTPDAKRMVGTWFADLHYRDQRGAVYAYLTIREDGGWVLGTFSGRPEAPERPQIERTGPDWRFGETPEGAVSALLHLPAPSEGADAGWFGQGPMVRLTNDELKMAPRAYHRSSPELAKTLQARAPTSAAATQPPARLQMRLVVPADDQTTPVDEFPDLQDPAKTLHVARAMVLDESAIKSASLASGSGGAFGGASFHSFGIQLALTANGRAKFEALPQPQREGQLAIILDGKLVAASLVQDPRDPNLLVTSERKAVGDEAGFRLRFEIETAVNAINSMTAGAATTAAAKGPDGAAVPADYSAVHKGRVVQQANGEIFLFEGGAGHYFPATLQSQLKAYVNQFVAVDCVHSFKQDDGIGPMPRAGRIVRIDKITPIAESPVKLPVEITLKFAKASFVEGEPITYTVEITSHGVGTALALHSAMTNLCQDFKQVDYLNLAPDDLYSQLHPYGDAALERNQVLGPGQKLSFTYTSPHHIPAGTYQVIYSVSAGGDQFLYQSEAVTLKVVPVVTPALIQDLAIRMGDKDWAVATKAITQASDLVAAQPKDADMAIFQPLVGPLFDHANWGGLARKDGMVAADALVRIGQPAVPTLVEKLKSKESHDRWSAMNMLGRIGQPKALVLASARDLLRDADAYVRRTAIDALGDLGTDALPAVQEVQALAFTGDDIQEVSVHRALIRIQGPSKERIATLAADLTGGTSDGSSFAAAVLGDLGPPAASAAPQLRAALKADAAQIRVNAADALGKIGADDDATINALIECLKNDSELYARQAAAMSLGSFGPKAKAALPELRQALAKEQEWWGWGDAVRRVEGAAATQGVGGAPAGAPATRADESDSTPSVIEPKQSDFMPVAGVGYVLTGGDLYKAGGAGPAGRDESKAWTIANEFVYRTGLRKLYKTPATSTAPHGEEFVMGFDALAGGPGGELQVWVSQDFKVVMRLGPGVNTAPQFNPPKGGTTNGGAAGASNPAARDEIP